MMIDEEEGWTGNDVLTLISAVFENASFQMVVRAEELPALVTCYVRPLPQSWWDLPRYTAESPTRDEAILPTYIFNCSRTRSRNAKGKTRGSFPSHHMNQCATNRCLVYLSD